MVCVMRGQAVALELKYASYRRYSRYNMAYRERVCSAAPGTFGRLATRKREQKHDGSGSMKMEACHADRVQIYFYKLYSSRRVHR